MIHPNTQRHARIWALIYVRQLIGRGYREEQAAQETSLGYGGPNDAGYVVSHGKISVPCYRPNWTFRFPELEKEALNPPVPTPPVQTAFDF